MNNGYRSEIKYLINSNDFNLIKCNLNPLLKKDIHCKKDYYTISSIYFDDYKNTSYFQVQRGLSERWKYRIRFYNYDDSFISLEKKYKTNDKALKKSVIITKEILDDIMNNKIKISKNNNSLLNEFIIKLNNDYLRPIILIEYDRVPYVYKLCNVRITLDYNIRYTNKYNNLFDKEKRMYYLNEKVLEVKYDYLIPDFIRNRLELNHLYQTSFSKYNNCIYSLNRRF